MELQNLSATLREANGKGPARRTRTRDRVPAVLYGMGKDPVALSVDLKSFIHLLHGRAGEHAIVQLEVSEGADHNGPAMLKEVQHDPIRGNVIHADFLRIDLKKKIHTVVPVNLVGRSKGVLDGGVMDQQLRDVEVECLALDVPDAIELDVSELGIGDSFHVSDLKAPDNVSLITPGERAVVAVLAPRVVEAAPVEGEVIEGAEAAAAGEGGEGEEKEGDK